MDGSEIDKALEDLETRMERLRALYEQYFMGIEKLEPQIPRKEIDRRITIFRKEQIRNTAQRFKFQTLIQRYNTMQQYWGRVTREIENGTFRRDVLKAVARFGEKEALTLLGKKKAKQYASLITAQANKQARARDLEEEEVELDAGDLIEEELVVDDPISAQSSTRTPIPKSAPSLGGGLRWGGPAPLKPALPADKPSSSDPRSDVYTADAQSGVKRRVAELAAVMKAAKGQEEPGGGFGALNLDFEDSSPGRNAPGTSRPGRGAPPAAQGGPTPGAHVTKPVPGARLPAPASPGAAVGFGSLDLPFEEDDAPTPASKQRLPAASPAKPSAAKAPAVSFGALDLDFDAAPKAPVDPPSHRRPAAPGPLTPGRPAPFPAVAPGKEPRAQRPLPGQAPVPAARPGMGGQAGNPFARTAPVQRPASASPQVPVAPKPAAPAPAPTAAAPRPPPAAPPDPSAEAALPEQRIRQLYSKYVDAKRAANESTAGVTYEKLAETLRAQATKLRASHPSKSVDYEVVMKDGRPHLKPVLR